MYYRICIIGRPGSGKSTLAFTLHKMLRLPVYYLDTYQFKENWQKCAEDEFIVQQQSIIQGDKWIVEGCATKTLDLRYARADLCIYLNYSRWTCLIRFFKKVVFDQNKQILDLPKGCKQTFSFKTFKVLHYLWTFDYHKNYFLPKLLRQLKSQHPSVKYIEIHNDQELEKFLNTCLKK